MGVGEAWRALLWPILVYNIYKNTKWALGTAGHNITGTRNHMMCVPSSH
jgi:hypothetical protein